MRTLRDYINHHINESSDDTKIRANIKFTIWEAPDKKVTRLKSNEEYLRISYQFKDSKKGIEIEFLLGYLSDDRTWNLYIGKFGGVSYDDDPYLCLETSDFNDAIVKSLDKIEEFIKKVQEDQENYLKFYLHK